MLFLMDNAESITKFAEIPRKLVLKKFISQIMVKNTVYKNLLDERL